MGFITCYSDKLADHFGEKKSVEADSTENNGDEQQEEGPPAKVQKTSSDGPRVPFLRYLKAIPQNAYLFHANRISFDSKGSYMYSFLYLGLLLLDLYLFSMQEIFCVNNRQYYSTKANRLFSPPAIASNLNIYVFHMHPFFPVHSFVIRRDLRIRCEIGLRKWRKHY